MALWELSAPIFLGTFAAIVLVIMLMGKTHELLRGPTALARWINGHDDGGRSCRRPVTSARRGPARRPLKLLAVPTPAPQAPAASGPRLPVATRTPSPVPMNSVGFGHAI